MTIQFTNILLFVLLLVSNQSLGQDTVFSLSLVKQAPMYRGVENELKIVSNSVDKNYTLLCDDCDTLFRSQDDSTHYKLVPGEARSLKLVVLNTSALKDTLYKTIVDVVTLPDPEMYLGGFVNGGKTNRKSNRFSLTYPRHMNLEEYRKGWEIVSWEIGILNEIYSGDGNMISDEVLAIFEANNDIKFFSVFLLAKCPDGVKRRIGGSFKF